MVCVSVDSFSPLSERYRGVAEEGQLLFQTTHTERQVAGRQDEQDDADGGEIQCVTKKFTKKRTFIPFN